MIQHFIHLTNICEMPVTLLSLMFLSYIKRSVLKKALTPKVSYWLYGSFWVIILQLFVLNVLQLECSCTKIPVLPFAYPIDLPFDFLGCVGVI